ncbi:MAG: peptidase S46 [Bacteroidetes bacterium RIFCSPLOWO2_12_FULL_35_15]|nr:MAG: peptidase S46 [Bacteroidetes bacterium RIFCSPLOWO2_12_FULL_35_15]
MKKIIIPFLIFNFSLLTSVKADEGMWLPMLLKQLNESDMLKNGLKLSAEDIYSINKSCLKDAIVHFGGGCTAEVISDKGLILTNHHCGYGQIQAHSTVQNDLLTNGFWAMNQSEELKNPGLTATFIIRMEDVTAKILSGITDSMSDALREAKINEAIAKIQKEAVAGTHYGAFVRPFYYGNEYYMFITEVFKDVRLVGAPPSSIGKFGGDTDNWMWPRHTGDFSMFRIYANKNNEPADYSPDNVPYKPKYHLTISMKGVEKDDFTMVYGFPGRTSEYLSSFAVDMIMNESDPAKVKIRTTRLKIIDEDMKASDKVRIQYSAKYAGLANYWKKWQGEMNGLKKLDAVNKKKLLEQDFLLKVNTDDAANAKYGKLFGDFEKKYGEFRILNKQRDYFVEAILGTEAVTYALGFTDVIDALKSGKKQADVQAAIDKLKTNAKAFFKDYNASTDEKVCAALLKMYSTDIDKKQQPEIFKEIEKKFKGDFEKYAKEVFSKSIFVSEIKINEAFEKMGKNYKKIEKDPIYQLMISCYTKFSKDVRPQYTALDDQITKLNGNYMKGMRELITTKKYYPDANGTLRVAYGKVEGYYPRDGVFYNYYTTLDGLMEKENPLVDEFMVSPKLKEIYQKKDYGPYADKNGELRIAFCASNHTTGGNSGSPVLNGEGQLIGTNFDRDWEGTMSDIMYDPNQVRNVVLDVRYTLFVIDKYAGAGYLLNEMTLVK